MNLLQEYEFESLPYIDSEYDNPVVSDLVHATIAAEMKTFNPNDRDYLAYLPYPSFRFSNSIALQTEFSRLMKSNGSSNMDKLDTKKNAINAPEGPLQKDIQAWRKAVANVKTHIEHINTNLINLEVSSEIAKDQWLISNQNLERLDKYLAEEIINRKRKISETNVVRRVAQEKAVAELGRILKRRDNAIFKQNQIILACDNMTN